MNEAAYDEHCSISDTCTNRSYLNSFLNPVVRGRRSTYTATINESAVDEANVATQWVHPCYYVDDNRHEYCFANICWDLCECGKIFPNDFPNFTSTVDCQKSNAETDEDDELDEMMDKIKNMFEKHIDELTDDDNETDFLKSLTDQANSVLSATHNIENIVQQLLGQVDTFKKSKE